MGNQERAAGERSGSTAVDFSVVIPTRNRPVRLAQCLDALCKLEYPREQFEVIVVDDGGTVELEPLVVKATGLDVRLLRQMSAALQIHVTSAICTQANAAWSLKVALVARWALPASSRALGIFIDSRPLRRGWCYKAVGAAFKLRGRFAANAFLSAMNALNECQKCSSTA